MVQILKPQSLIVNYCTINLKRKYKLVTTTIIGFTLDSGNIISENQILQQFYQDPQRQLDHGFPKAQGEIIVAGSVAIENDQPFQSRKICVSVGPIQKSALIFGKRAWKKQEEQIVMIADEEENNPIRHVTLTPENAFGGESCVVNPIGLGYNAIKQLEYQETVPLPLVEDLNYPIQAPSDSPLPLWFSPTPFIFPDDICRAPAGALQISITPG